MIIVGTAGHIDHGKSSLVLRLTGTDPDRLPEEKARGMTIDLGFAFLSLPSGAVVGFVDVPGHERFVKTMVAGAGGVDIVLLVVAADDGWMPQTEEHLQILRLLGVSRGLVLLNKADLASPELLQQRTQEIRTRLGRSLLHDAPIMPVSAVTGQGIPEIVSALDRLSTEVQRGTSDEPARLAIDRTFVQTGIGMVGTGTLRDGLVRVGDTVTVWPSLKQGKIRTLQSRGKDVVTASPGFRTAISLSGEAREALTRGTVVTTRPGLDILQSMPVLVLSVEILVASPVALEERRRVLMLAGTSEAAGEVRLLFDESLPPGGNGVIFIRPEEPLYALVGDPVILRLETPMVTIGGARVLAHLPELPRRKERTRWEYFRQQSVSPLADAIMAALFRQVLADEATLLPYSRWTKQEIRQVTHDLVAAGKICEVSGMFAVESVLTATLQQLKTDLDAALAAAPHLRAMPPELLPALRSIPEASRMPVLRVAEARGIVHLNGQHVAPGQMHEELKGIIKQTYDGLLDELAAARFEGLVLTELGKRGKLTQQAVRIAIERNTGKKVGSEFLLLAERWRDVVQFLSDHFRSSPTLGIVHLKDRFGLTRKFAVPMLEEADRLGLTVRQGDVRLPGPAVTRKAAP